MRRFILNLTCVVVLCGSLVGLFTVMSDLVSSQGRIGLVELLFGCLFGLVGVSACYVLLKKTHRGIKLLLLEITLIGGGSLTDRMGRMHGGTSPLLVFLEATVTLMLITLVYSGLCRVFLPLVHDDHERGDS